MRREELLQGFVGPAGTERQRESVGKTPLVLATPDRHERLTPEGAVAAPGFRRDEVVPGDRQVHRGVARRLGLDGRNAEGAQHREGHDKCHGAHGDPGDEPPRQLAEGQQDDGDDRQDGERPEGWGHPAVAGDPAHVPEEQGEQH